MRAREAHHQRQRRRRRGQRHGVRRAAADAVKFTVDPAKAAQAKAKAAEKVVAEDKENAAANGAEKKKSADPDMEEEAYMAAKLACSLANKDDCVMCGA